MEEKNSIVSTEWDSEKGIYTIRYNENDKEDRNAYSGEISPENKPNGYGTMWYSNGQVYEGTWKNGYMDGKGVFYYPNGEYYEGDFLRDAFWGNGDFYVNVTIDGRQWVDSDEKLEGNQLRKKQFSGEWCNEKREGYGIYYFPSMKENQDIEFEGVFKDNKKNGVGKRFVLNKEGNPVLLYDGEWENDQMNGDGKYFCIDCSKTKKDENFPRYEGQFKNDQFNGLGKYFFESGCKFEGTLVNDENNLPRYEGEFKNDQMNGLGKYFFESGCRFEGTFVNDVREGSGVSYDKNGRKRYEGSYLNDERSGKGKQFYRNGNFYDGEWKNGKKEGHGQKDYYDKEKKLYSFNGEYKKGKKIEDSGRYLYPSGAIFNGTMKKGKKEGKGIFYFPNGVLGFQGTFRNDMMINGKLKFENGDEYVGDFDNDGELHGNGKLSKLCFEKGEIIEVQVLEGKFERNNFVDGTTTYLDGAEYLQMNKPEEVDSQLSQEWVETVPKYGKVKSCKSGEKRGREESPESSSDEPNQGLGISTPSKLDKHHAKKKRKI